MKRKPSIPVQLALGAVFSVSAIALIGYTSVQSIQDLRAASREVERTQDIITDLEILFSELKEAETGSRGFVITGSERYLDNFRRVPGQVEAVLERLRRSIRSPESVEMLERLQPLVAQRLRMVEELIEVRRTKGLEAAKEIVLSGRGRKVMDRAREEIESLEIDQRRLLAARLAQANARGRSAAVVAVFGGFVSCALLLAAAVMIGRRLRAERRLAKELESFFTLSVDLLVISDHQGRFQRINESWTRTLGWSFKDLTSKPFLEFVHPEDREKTIKEMESLGQGRPTSAFENRYLCRDGSYKTLLWTGFPGGEKIYAVARDVTEERALDAVREQVNHHVNHELRSPVSALGLAVGMMKDELPKDCSETLRTAIEVAIRSVDHLSRMITDLVEVTRAETGKLSINPETFDLTKAAGELVVSMKPSAAAKSLGLSLAAPPGTLPVHADPTRVRQVLANLIDNAFKFTPSGGQVVVSVEPDPDDETMRRVAVSDTGQGLTSEEVGRIFDRLYQTANIARKGMKGLGLGLFICRELVERQGGRIWVESEKGKGSVFLFTLPKEKLPEREAVAG